jgi:hypothetical protein
VMYGGPRRSGVDDGKELLWNGIQML